MSHIKISRFVIVLRTDYTSGNQKKEGKMGRACGMSAGNLQEGGDSEHLGVDGKINVKR
jgi:hypothetical protein